MDGSLLLQWLRRWVTPESLPAWVAALFMGGGWFQQWYRGRIGPSKIVVFEANRTLFTKLPEAKRRLSMLFNGQEIEHLAMIDLVVQNEGASAIEDIEFTIEVNKEARILAIQLQRRPPGVAMSWRGPEGEQNRWTFDMAHLNPLSLAKEQVRFALFCDPEPETIQIGGGGKGWSLEFLGQAELQALKEKRTRMWAPVGIMAVILYFGFIFAVMGSIDFVLRRLVPGWTGGRWQGVFFLVLSIGALIVVSWPWMKVFEVIKRLSKPYP